MKKICVLMSLIVLCTVLFSACDKNEGNDTTQKAETTAVSTTAEQTTLSADELAAQQKEAEYAKKCIETLILSKNPDEIKKITRNAGEDYAQEVIDGFPYDDYTVAVQKIGTYKDYVIYNIEIDRDIENNTGEFYFSGIQIFARAENGLLIELDTTVEDDVVAKFHCRNCSGTGSVGYDEVHGVEYKCSTCKGVGFVF